MAKIQSIKTAFTETELKHLERALEEYLLNHSFPAYETMIIDHLFANVEYARSMKQQGI